MKCAQVLVVDDDHAVGMVLGALLTQAGHRAHVVRSAEAALAALASRDIDVVISDVRMPGMDGLELLAAIKKRELDVPVLLLTAHGSVPMAVEAMKGGAADFLQKPFDRDEVLFALEKALRANEPARTAAPSPPREDGVVAGSSFAKVLDQAKKVAASPMAVLVRGESGTGKELVAKAIHAASPRHAAPFVAVNCAALPDGLLESELFGYERGAFTGAVQRKPGRVELAEGGTLFLDEIGEASPGLQAKLLRLLEQGEYLRVGATRVSKADVRFVSATHRPLEAMVTAGTFREDLFYRLSRFPITLPPLRDRAGDVVELASLFLTRHATRAGRPGLAFTSDALTELTRHDWPGNVRELEGTIERLVLFGEGAAITADEVRAQLLGRRHTPEALIAASDDPLDVQRANLEAAAIRDALARAQGNRTQAARLLGIARRTLYNKLDELGIS